MIYAFTQIHSPNPFDDFVLRDVVQNIRAGGVYATIPDITGEHAHFPAVLLDHDLLCSKLARICPIIRTLRQKFLPRHPPLAASGIIAKEDHGSGHMSIV